MLVEVSETLIVMCMGGMMINVLAYADNLVLLAPSWRAMQHYCELLKLALVG